VHGAEGLGNLDAEAVFRLAMGLSPGELLYSDASSGTSSPGEIPAASCSSYGGTHYTKPLTASPFAAKRSRSSVETKS
jgi:hypothetical protein